ncbi:DUF5131 family protein [Magnetospirillum fulvum]|uniref:Phage Gp37Gp68 n=1 Tax=Magnetospirillum fulvum MGU-K5 TaxID=1316936 RepID=S9TF78_MAGFU|nr:phage Gp37/Gp68 family protein [Magnetospirillum fulvum]EPY00916.1 phage Gp37Gp68 [Magnetospirillum fulvum MGU-K5]
MSDHSAIEWTDATWQIASGCSPVSAGCRNCYSARLAGTRLKHHPRCQGLTWQPDNGRHVWTGEVRLHPDQLDQPLRWRKGRRIFVGDRTDLFHPAIPDDYIDRVWAVMALTPRHTYQVLTKRPERMREYLDNDLLGIRLSDLIDSEWRDGRRGEPIVSLPLPNVWIGVSIEDQTTADARIDHLRDTPAAVRWVSYEPALGPVDLGHCLDGLPPNYWITQIDCLDWVVMGGESGPHARPMHPDWARGLRDQCAAAGVPFMLKQWGEWTSIYDRDRDDPDWQRCPTVDGQMGRGDERYLNLAGGCGFHGDRVIAVCNVGKHSAGRLLDGVEHNGMPGEVAK